MRIKFCLIIICLIIFGCKSVKEPDYDYIERIGQLTPGGGGTPTLEVYVDKEDRYYMYHLSFPHPNGDGKTWYQGDYDTLPFGEIVKVIGVESSYWAAENYYKLHIMVKSIELYDGNYKHGPEPQPPEVINE